MMPRHKVLAHLEVLFEPVVSFFADIQCDSNSVLHTNYLSPIEQSSVGDAMSPPTLPTERSVILLVVPFDAI
jgi:hypothetical protein